MDVASEIRRKVGLSLDAKEVDNGLIGIRQNSFRYVQQVQCRLARSIDAGGHFETSLHES
jgi:hypothetical protein